MAVIEQRFSWAFVARLFRRRRSQTQTSPSSNDGFAPQLRCASGSSSSSIGQQQQQPQPQPPRKRSHSGRRFRFLKLASIRSEPSQTKDAIADLDLTRFDPPSFNCRSISVSISSSSSNSDGGGGELPGKGGQHHRGRSARSSHPFRNLFSKAPKARRRSGRRPA